MSNDSWLYTANVYISDNHHDGAMETIGGGADDIGWLIVI